MLRIDGKNITLDRGDSAEVTFSFQSDPPEEGTEVLFSVNDGEKPVIQKNLQVGEDGSITLSLDSQDTNQKEQSYTYGLYVQYSERTGYAPLTRARFMVNPSEAFPGVVMV